MKTSNIVFFLSRLGGCSDFQDFFLLVHFLSRRLKTSNNLLFDKRSTGCSDLWDYFFCIFIGWRIETNNIYFLRLHNGYC